VPSTREASVRVPSTRGASVHVPSNKEASFTSAQDRREHCSFAMFRLGTSVYRIATGKLTRLPERIWSYQTCIAPPSLLEKPRNKGRFFHRTALYRVYRESLVIRGGSFTELHCSKSVEIDLALLI